MSNIMNDLHTVGINPFGVVLVAESVLKSPIAEISASKPLTFFMPIERGDCAGWVGVEITLKAIKERSNQHCGAVETGASQDVLAERRRQIEAEGWTPEHDDEHNGWELVLAAADLCLDGTDFHVADTAGDRLIGWGLTEKHHGNRRRQLVIAGALILAEIERLDRAAVKGGAQ